MYGIAGFWGEADGPLLDEMMALQVHHGPEAQGNSDTIAVRWTLEGDPAEVPSPGPKAA